MPVVLPFDPAQVVIGASSLLPQEVDLSKPYHDFLRFIVHAWAGFMVWLSQPQVYYPLMAWAITFGVICTIAFNIGFAPGGILAGSLAAGFQSWMYGGFTPAGSFFAILTSGAMLGLLMPPIALLAAVIATGVAAIVWAFVS